MNQLEFDEILNRLHAVYPHQTTSDQGRVELFRVLAPFEHKRVDLAVNAWVEKSEYYPKPSNLLELIDKAPGALVADCGVCSGTGWIETTAPEVDAEGNRAQGAEQPWVYKCKVCGGSGRGHG
jgi:hypothetical protein